ncbi:MAG TPA: hypothetical protein VH762_10940 [Gemmatimonadaceae bacterium]|jgi:hypothetical protein
MSRILKISAAAATMLVAALALIANPTHSWADVTLCKPTGCPTGTQLCATITAGVPGAGSVTFHCYQPMPVGGGGSPTGPKK